MKRYLTVGVVLTVSVVALILGIVAGIAWLEKDATKEIVTPSSPPAPPPATLTPPREPKSAPKVPRARAVTFSARHKHRFRDCEGVLTLSVNSIRYQTSHPEDSFTYSIEQVELDNDGVKDRAGKAWHFAVEGRDMEAVFKQWKLGVLPAQ